jgi:nicotinate-nucleotide pyrophosphorylase (carboxylating)
MKLSRKRGMLSVMGNQFEQVVWDGDARRRLAAIVELAVAEDLGSRGDVTSLALADAKAEGRAAVVARREGVAAGLAGVEQILAAFEPRLQWTPSAADGDVVSAGQRAGEISGPARGILAAERTMLNIVGRLSGIATLTRRYVEAVAGTRAHVFDTRKTTPGWRRLEKYAVRCGGGWNHRGGLDQAVLIKDNHLAFGGAARRFSPAKAVALARQYAAERLFGAELPVEIEVDSLQQLTEVLPVRPDIVLLDNMTPEQLRGAVELRDSIAPGVVLEASGGVSLETVRQIALSGVERISVGALTHSAPALDLGLDWIF